MAEIHEIRVVSTEPVDPRAHSVEHEIQNALGEEIEVQTATIYRLQGITDEQAQMLGGKLLADSVVETYTVDPGTERQLSFTFFANGSVGPYLDDERNGDHITREVGYKPGVMNPRAASIVKAAKDLGLNPEAADTSEEFIFPENTPDELVENVVTKLLMNQTVQQVITKKPDSLTTTGEVGQTKTVPVRDATDEQLMELSTDKLFLNLNEMRAIKEKFKQLEREPTDCELEIIAAAWSEHCGHKTFNAEIELRDGTRKEALFRRIKDTARKHFGDRILSAFGDNSGVIRAFNGWAINGKVETHNKPSSIEPYGGSMTGTGGVDRDVRATGQGAKTIISTDMFCLAPPDLSDDRLPEGTLRPDYIQRKVVEGVRDYGNRMGIPTGNGSLHFHEDFRTNPTVIVGAYGILPEKYAQKGEPQVGDLVVVIGGRTGRDGIHGATFSSGDSTDRTATVNSSAVQIGNAIEQKRVADAIIEARDADCIRAITDCGAAGFSSAIGEIGEDTGVTIDLANAPLKYEGLAPWEIFLSESQERMVLAVPPEQAELLNAICMKNNVEASVLGEFDGSHTLTVNYDGENVAEIDYEFLKNGLPDRVMKAAWVAEEIEVVAPEAPITSAEWITALEKVMAHGNVCSKEPIVRQYDHGVQGGNIVSPFGGKTEEGPNDALVVRPILDENWGVVQAHGMNPILVRLDPYDGSIWAITEAMSNYVAVGGDPREAALINNFIWPSPDEQEMGSLDRSVDAITDMMNALKTPVISGKDSLSSTYRGKDGEVIKIPPVLCMSAFGCIPDVERTTTSDFKKAGSTLVLVGDPSSKMGGSTYYDIAGGQSGEVPEIDIEKLPQTFIAVHESIKSGKALSCHDVSEGGLAAAVTEMAIGGNCGAAIDIPDHTDAAEFLFNETAGCFVIEVENEVEAARLFKDVNYRIIGNTIEEPYLHVDNDNGNKNLFTTKIDHLKKAWQQPTKELF